MIKIIKNASDLKFQVEQANPESKFFSRNNMKFAGDTIKNFGVRGPILINTLNGQMLAYELYRKRETTKGFTGSFWFCSTTFERVHKMS